MEEKTYVGYSFGTFRDDAGMEHSYCSVYMLEPFVGEESANRHFGGMNAVKYRCDSPDIFKDVAPGTEVQCYFSGKGKLAFMQPLRAVKAKD
ncbi:MAG: hypothetical protein LUH36_01130 [Oscillospiraceae bacterium]|nr:hypothetical protein [Oscillospiraceae bacterium]